LAAEGRLGAHAESAAPIKSMMSETALVHHVRERPPRALYGLCQRIGRATLVPPVAT
jgi:hypothetical protein